jgi:two-component system cell cycle sensor histidine kinase/response regulator CckA
MTNLTQNPAAEVTTPVVSCHSNEPANAAISHGTILLVEDDPTVSEIVSQLVVSLGYEVVSAPSAGDAVLEFRKHQKCIDMMLTDRLMPGVNGLELAEIVCQINPALKVIFMSGQLPEAVPEGQTINFLQKPFSRDDLARKLAEVMHLPSPAPASQVIEDPDLHPQPALVR